MYKTNIEIAFGMIKKLVKLSRLSIFYVMNWMKICTDSMLVNIGS
jgi:hypothetical protein